MLTDSSYIFCSIVLHNYIIYGKILTLYEQYVKLILISNWFFISISANAEINETIEKNCQIEEIMVAKR